MEQIDEARLETDLNYRFKYIKEFIGLTDSEIKLIKSSAQHLGPRIPQLVEQTYQKLLHYDATARHFVPKQHGYEGDSLPNLQQLSAEHPQIKFRKDHLNRYFMQLIGRAYDDRMIVYLDMVGKIHTPKAGNKDINVPLIQMNALMGVISHVLFESISQWPIPPETSMQTILAFNKLLWIQNDFITRHYASTT